MKGAFYMRVTPISVVRPYAQNLNTSKKEQAQVQTPQPPSFKGWRGPTFATFGAFLGLFMGIIFSLGMSTTSLLSMTGTTAGGIYGNTKDNHSGNNDYQYNVACQSYREF